APFLSAWMARRKAVGGGPDVVQKMAIGLILLSFGYVFMSGAAGIIASGEKASGLWFAAGYLFFGLAEVFIWPPQLAVASQLAPARIQSFVVGCWFIATGVGSFLTGYVGAVGYSAGMLTLFIGLMAACIAGACIVMLLRPAIKRLMHEDAFLTQTS
ncbi:MAG: hypothetical protein ACRCY3_15265, partial [Sphingorhabdus sp.]